MEEKKKKKYNPYWKKKKHSHKPNDSAKPNTNVDAEESNESAAESSAPQLEKNHNDNHGSEHLKDSKAKHNETEVSAPTDSAPHESKPQPTGDRKNGAKITHGKQSSNNASATKNKGKEKTERKPKKQNTVADLYEIIHGSEVENKGIEVTNDVPEQYDPSKRVTVVGVRYKDGGKTYYFDPKDMEFSIDDKVIVDTSRGEEYGFVSVPNKEVRMTELVADLKCVIRKATAEDDEKYEKNKLVEEKAKKIWPQRIAAFELVMQLVDVDYTFDNSKLIFYYTADGRVDFRELVKDLASIFHTRIELRQIGVRDEAKLLGGLGICGRPFCCKEFLSEFAQVSIKMAKEQNLSLTSSKISGNCGRLMCCLSFEQKVYEMEYATFPKVDSLVETPNGKGVICESNFLNGKIKVKLMDADRAQPAKTFTSDQIKVIGMVRRKEIEELPPEE